MTKGNEWIIKYFSIEAISDYEYVEEDIFNESSPHLEWNPFTRRFQFLSMPKNQFQSHSLSLNTLMKHDSNINFCLTILIKELFLILG
ncbi:hypothetical protein MTR_3g011050 [Medicago truncatula]|uniref:Uncharacterized protein n=1 Tax=Medicago truncatula TaxID=3880 RepID=G7IVQ5_MEDTR|nr:hypothetical protein MTR_3g011050 [Medicago truncatula]